MNLFFRRSNVLIKDLLRYGEWRLVEKTEGGICTLINEKSNEAKTREEKKLIPVLLNERQGE